MFAQSLSLLVIFLTIIGGIFFNNKALSDFKAEMKSDMKDMKADLKGDISALRSEVKSDIARIDSRLNLMQTDLQHFYELKGHLEGRIDEIAKRVAA